MTTAPHAGTCTARGRICLEQEVKLVVQQLERQNLMLKALLERQGIKLEI